MKLLIIPSWYPSERYPNTGIFFREQAQILARKNPEWSIGLSLWGSHEPALWISLFRPIDSLLKLTSRFPIRPFEKLLEANCAIFFTPAHTWSRKLKQGNIKGIISANEQNLKKYTDYFGKPEMILAENAYPAGKVAMELSRKFHIPFIIREHSSPFPMPSFSRDYRKFLLPPLKKAHAVLAVGDNLQAELKSYGIEAHRTLNFIDLDFFKRSKREKQQPVLKILALGRMVPQKGFDLLLISLAKLSNNSWELALGGSGPKRKSLERLSQKLGIRDQVHFLGELDRIQVKEQMQSCDFFTLTSRHESFGVVLLEAMACGKPVLVTKCGGITDELPEEIGIKTDINQQSISECLVKMMESCKAFDPDLIRKFVIENYSVDQASNQLQEILKEIN